MNAAYKRHAYTRSILYELERHLMDRFVSVDAPAKAEIICEEVFYADRTVPQEALQDTVNFLRRMQDHERLQMADFVTRRSSEFDPALPKEVPNEQQKVRERRKRKGEAPQ